MTPLTISATVRASSSVVYRMLSICRRYRAQIESVTVARTENEGIAKITLVVRGALATPLLAQLRKPVDVLEVHAEGEPIESAHKPPSLAPHVDTDSRSPFPRHSAQADGAF